MGEWGQRQRHISFTEHSLHRFQSRAQKLIRQHQCPASHQRGFSSVLNLIWSPLSQGSGRLWPTDLAPYLFSANKVLLEHNHTHLFTTGHGCSLATMAEMNNNDPWLRGENRKNRREFPDRGQACTHTWRCKEQVIMKAWESYNLQSQDLPEESLVHPRGRRQCSQMS